MPTRRAECAEAYAYKSLYTETNKARIPRCREVDSLHEGMPATPTRIDRPTVCRYCGSSPHTKRGNRNAYPATLIGEKIAITILDVKGAQVRVGIQAKTADT